MSAPNSQRDLYAGLIRLHILHHACEGPIYGLWIIEELARHGYLLSAGTLYPMLHRMERLAWLRSDSLRNGRSIRRIYKATRDGRRVLHQARRQVRELFGELFEREGELKKIVRRTVIRTSPRARRKHTSAAKRRRFM